MNFLVKIWHRKAWAGTALFIVALSGCGYTLEGTKRPEGLKGAGSIVIPIFQDETSEPGLGFVMARSARERFLNDGRLRVVEGGGADLRLSAIVREYRLDPIGFSGTDQVRRYRIFVRTFVRLMDLRSGKVILSQDIESDSEFNIEGTVSGSAQNRDDTNRRAADFFAEDLLSLILEGF